MKREFTIIDIQINDEEFIHLDELNDVEKFFIKVLKKHKNERDEVSMNDLVNHFPNIEYEVLNVIMINLNELGMVGLTIHYD
jgi:hypothetical protein